MNWTAKGPVMFCGPYRVGPAVRGYKATYDHTRGLMPEIIGIFTTAREAKEACEVHQEAVQRQWA